MRYRSHILLMVLLVTATDAMAQRPTPAPRPSKSYLITGGTVHIGDGRTIDEGAVGLRGGMIDYVGHAYGVQAAYDSTINARGKHIYPGFIAPNSIIGLVEIELVRASNDQDELGNLTPEVRAITAYNTDSRTIPTVRSNGVLMAQVTPRSGTIAGTSSIVQLDAWDNADAAVKADDAIHMNWPDAFQRHGWWANPGPTTADPEDEHAQHLRDINAFFAQAKAYAARPANAPGPVDVRLAAMRGLFDGSKALFINVDVAREIQEAVLFAKDLDIKRLVIVGGYDAWRVAPLLRDNNIPVVLRRLHSLPLRDDDDVDLPYRLPALLKQAGVHFCLGYAGDMEHAGVRSLPFVAGTASAYGLTREEALSAITLDAARILGIEERCGSLHVGKDATVVVSTGDALDMRGNNVEVAFIQGRKIPLDDHHKALYRQYSDRPKE